MSKHYIFVDFFFAQLIKIDVIRTNGKGRVQFVPLLTSLMFSSKALAYPSGAPL
jgi:hypothetical protein